MGIILLHTWFRFIVKIASFDSGTDGFLPGMMPTK